MTVFLNAASILPSRSELRQIKQTLFVFGIWQSSQRGASQIRFQ
jgi:hypothetical protein